MGVFGKWLLVKPNCLIVGSARLAFASRIRARQTADGLRQSVRLPRSKTFLCTAGSASLSCLAALSSMSLCLMKSSTSSGDGLLSRPLPADRDRDRDRDRDCCRRERDLDRDRLRFAALRSSFAARILEISDALGLRMSEPMSPRSKTARCILPSSLRNVAAARSSTPDFRMKSSISSAKPIGAPTQ